MWARAAKAIAGFKEGVITGVDARGYPVSMRVLDLAYDATSGEVPLSIPSSLDVTPGPANLLCHGHNDKLWDMKMISIKGKLEPRGERWVFITTAYVPQSQLAMIGNIRRATRSYLEKRKLPMPPVDFDAVKRLWARAKQIQNP